MANAVAVVLVARFLKAGLCADYGRGEGIEEVQSVVDQQHKGIYIINGWTYLDVLFVSFVVNGK